MRLSLHCHPQSPASAVDGTWVNYSWVTGDSLRIGYYLEGAINKLRLPPRAKPERVDGLWQDTCFELFLRQPLADNYYEFNFSPSGRWAAYRFSGYREGMINLASIRQPDIALDSSDSHVAVEVTLDLSGIARKTALSAAFSAVIADKDGSRSYWALSHPPGKPDFHHKDSFTHQLKAADSI